VATAALLIIFTTIAYAQTLAPPKLAVTASQPPPAKKDSVQVVTKETPEVIVTETPHVPQVITKEPQVVTKETVSHERKTRRRGEGNAVSSDEAKAGSN
jgi:hypothetical protein